MRLERRLRTWEKRRTLKLPELIIGYDLNGMPTDAVCSVCGKWMREADPLYSNPSNAITAFSNQFIAHVEEAHPLPLIT